MDNVVYFLGAGFSAPQGLPLVSDFFEKSKEMFAENPARYAHFAEVFKSVKELSVIKNYFEANLFNIEEILSILEMGEHLEGKHLSETFIRYLIDVIEYYTPEIALHPPHQLPGNWANWLFGSNPTWNSYGIFICSVLNMSFSPRQPRGGVQRYLDILASFNKAPKARYSIVTVNYDLIPEIICNFINDNYWVNENERISFRHTVVENPVSSPMYVPWISALAKLHGSVNTTIVPPTWNKGNAPDIIPAWKLAYQELSRANHIRMIGYSMPTTDSYIKYLLKSAIAANDHLKRIDVICLDGDGSVESRYNEFINFKNYRFLNNNVTDYFKRLDAKHQISRTPVVFDLLEDAHQEFIHFFGR